MLSIFSRLFLGELPIAALVVGAVLHSGFVNAAQVTTDYKRTVITIEGSRSFIISPTGNPINKSGLVAGSTRYNGHQRAAILDTVRNRVYVLPTLGGLTAEARDINSGSYVVGGADTRSGERHGFLWLPYNHQMIDLGTLGGKHSLATSLNDDGFVIGSAMTASGEIHAFRRHPRTFKMLDLGTLGGRRSEALSINSAGYIVGSAYDKLNGSRAFLWDPSTLKMRDIGTLPGTNLARANDINQSLVVVGESFTAASNSSKPFIWASHLTRPNPLPGVVGWGSANNVSPDGTVVGYLNPRSRFNPRAVAWLRYGRDVSELPAPGGVANASAISRNNRVIGTTGESVVRWDLGPQTERVSVSTTGIQGDGASGLDGSNISGDGGFVIFESRATNLVGDGRGGVFMSDWKIGETNRTTKALNKRPTVSADGRFAALVLPGEDDNGSEIFVQDRATGYLTQVSPDGGQRCYYHEPTITPDGRFVAFSGYGCHGIFVSTRLGESVAFVEGIVILDPVAENLFYGSSNPTITPDGRFVAFHSYSTGLVPDDTNDSLDAFVLDVLSGVTTRVSVDSNGRQVGSAPEGCHPRGTTFCLGPAVGFAPSISADGRFVSFTSFSDQLVPGDTNGESDVFVRDLGRPPELAVRDP